MSANIGDFSDRGIMLAIEDAYGEDGFAHIDAIGAALGLERINGLGVRLGWMRRFGLVVKHHGPGQARWRVSTPGERALGVAMEHIERIERSGKLEFTLLRRTVEHRRRGG